MLNSLAALTLQRTFGVARVLRTMSKKCKLDPTTTGSTSSRSPRESIPDVGLHDKCGNDVKYEFLTKPEKSPTDKKEYSVIRLHNGLTALLVTDHPVVDLSARNHEDSACAESSSMSESDEDSMASNEDSVDSNESQAGMKRRGGEGDEKIAACALCVGVGSFSDPEDIPGLAHFLEHMVFMGSTKYPAENEFDAFIKKKGGSDNACTECEHTTFYFECQEEYLHEAMDIFSQFFISPLMKYDAMSRERQAVESEYRMALPSDDYRKDQLLSSLAAKENPAGKFMWGNLETLRDNVNDDHLHQSLHEFRKRHYSAHNMTLAVQARLSQEVLASWVQDCFSKVESNGLPPVEHPKLEQPYSLDTFHKIYYVEPVNDICEVELTWCLPPTQDLYKAKPLDYASWLFGHEGSGGLVSYLRRKVWALGIVAGEGDDIGSNSLYSLFSIKIQLTEEGYEHIEEILNSTFSYVKLLQTTGPVQRIFEEIKAMSDMNWQYYEETSPVENVEVLAESMRLFPPEHYLCGSDRFFEYRPDLIQQFLSLLCPSNVNIVISSKRVREQIELDQTEKWFGTKYTSCPVPDAWLQTWARGDGLDNFHIPDPNPFIPTDLSILPVDEKYAAAKYPRKIKSEDRVELWFKEDVKFNLPQALMYFFLISPVHNTSPLGRAMLDVYTAALGQLLTEDTYPAVAAEMGYVISCNDRGLVVSVNGFNQNLHLLVEKIVTGMLTFDENLSRDMFEAVKRLQRRYYINQNLKAGTLASELRMLTTLNVYWPLLDRVRSLNDVTYEGLVNFSKEFYSTLYVRGLIQGNMSEAHANEITQNLVNRLVKSPLHEEMRPNVRVCRLEEGQASIRARSFNSEDVNCVTTLYYQDGPGTIKQYCVLEVLQMLLEEPLFDTLRTREQLGYDVSCSLRETYGILGFSITVISQRDKVTVDHVQQRIEAFLRTCLDHIKGLSATEFNEAVTAIIKLKQYSDVHLKEEVMRNWGEVKNQEYVFDRLDKEVDLLNTVTVDEVYKFLQNLLESTGRKLVVQVVSEPSSQSSSTNDLQLLSPTSGFITDIAAFKRPLHVYPIHKMDH